jgi:hypothetical protein
MKSAVTAAICDDQKSDFKSVFAEYAPLDTLPPKQYHFSDICGVKHQSYDKRTDLFVIHMLHPLYVLA